ncbi:MAG: hypothetical protein MI725_01145 [Pirellulales bacterium]|nr:hypothetical protein [Pirellulales bacterium]
MLDETKKREVCALVAAGCSFDFAGRYVGCSAKTIRREGERDAAFGERLRQAQLSAQLEPLRALRSKATTHWRAAAWLLERVDPEQFARFDRKQYHPQEVADLLENIRAALVDHLAHLPSQVIAEGLLEKALNDARLPKGRRHLQAKLSELTIGFPELLASFQKPAVLQQTD